MIIAHNISAINTYNRMGISSKGADKSMEKLSSGYRINRAADDAAGLSISEKMRSQIRGLNQASENAQHGISMIQTAEGALNESHSILQRMRELAVQSANDTNAASDREALQSEIDQLTSEINRIGNTTEFNGMKILNGSKIKTTGKEEIEVTIGDTITLATGTPGAKNEANLELVGNIEISTPTPAELDLTKLQAAEGVNTIEISQKDGKLITNIKLTEADGTTVTNPGLASLNVVAEELIQQANGDWVYDNHGIKFTISKDSATKYLTNSSGDKVASIDLFTANGADTTAAINSTAKTYNIINDYEADSSYNGALKAITLADFGDGTTRLDYDRVEIEYQNAADTDSGSLTVKFFNGSDLILTDTISSAGKNAITADNTELTKYAANGLSFTVVGNDGFGVTDKVHAIIDLDEKLGTETVQGRGQASDNSVYFHVGAGTNQVINTTFSDMRAHALGLTGNGKGFSDTLTVNNGTDSTNTERGLDISTREGANAALDVIDKAISLVSAERSKYGAIQNRLEYTINNLDTTSENMTSAESTIRDTDMAQEMMDMTKNNILQQASQAMLSQAMQRPQQVLQLLQ